MNPDLLVATATGVGLALVSSVHCLVMCGPLAAATRSRGGSSALWQYGAGRLASYSLLGLLAGSVGNVLADSRFARWGEAALSWLLASSLLVTALGHLRKARSAPLLTLGRAPQRSIISRVFLRIADEPLLLGMATALLPCGALLSAMLAAAALGAPLSGALAMASFGAGSGVVLLAAAQLSRLSALGVAGRKALAGVLLVGAAIMLLRPLPMLQSDGQTSCHQAPGKH